MRGFGDGGSRILWLVAAQLAGLLTLALAAPAMAVEPVAYTGGSAAGCAVSECVYAAQSDGSGKRLVRSGARVGAFSSDAGLIAIEHNVASGNLVEVISQYDGIVREQYTPPSGAYWHPSGFSPSGDRLLIIGDIAGAPPFGIGVLTRASQTPTPLFTSWVGAKAWATYSPDGTKIAFSANSSPNGKYFSKNQATYNVYVAAADGSNPQKLTSLSSGAAMAPQFSPDGTKLTYYRTGGTASTNGVYTMNVSGSSQTRISDLGTRPMWSTDGQFILAADISNNVYRMNSDGSNRTLTTILATSTPMFRQRNTEAMTDAELLLRFSPLMQYDQDESYRADDVHVLTDMHVDSPPESVRSNKLIDSVGNTIADASPVSNPQLTAGFLNSPFYTGTSINSSATDWIDVYGSTEDDYRPDAQRMHNIGGYGNKLYGRAINSPAGTWLQYWAFYYYDVVPGFAGVGDHEGDWELTQVLLDSNRAPARMTFAAHEDSRAQKCDWGQVVHGYGLYTRGNGVITGMVIPKVYVARGTHASYPFPGDYQRTYSSWFGFVNITLTDQADGYWPESPETLWGALAGNDGASAVWSRWPGHWGNSRASNQAEQNSPLGPAFQSLRWGTPDNFDSQALACGAGLVAGSGGFAATAAATRSGRAALAPRRARGPAPRVRARATASGLRVHYRLPGRSGRLPLSITLVADGTDGRQPPVSRTIKVGSRIGSASITRPLERGPFIVRAFYTDRQFRESSAAQVRVR